MEHNKPYNPTGHEHEGLQAVPYGEHPEVVSQVPGHQYYDEPSRKAGYTQYTVDKPLPREGGRGTIFGLRKPTFFLSLLLAIAVIAIGVVGGVLGTKKTTSDATCTSSPTTSSSGTTSAPTSSATSITASAQSASLVNIPLNCPTINQTTVTNPYLVNGGTYSYKITCGQDCDGENIFPIWAYSLDMCMQACVNMNNVNATDKQCQAAAFRADMGNVTVLGGNCFLKTDCNTPVLQGVQIAHAVLT